jgi:hypothetical protein
LLRVTLEARFVSAQESKTAGFELLLNVCRRAFDRDAFVQFVTIAAADFAFRHGVMVRQCERCADFEVTLETGLGRLSRIYDGTRAASRFDVQTPRAVAGLAAHIRDFFYSCALCFTAFSAARLYDFAFLCLQSRVSGRSEIAHDLFVARRAFLRADELRAGDAGRRENCSVRRAAGQENHRERDCSSGAPQQGLAPTVDPSGYSRTPHELRVCAETRCDDYSFIRNLFWARIGVLATLLTNGLQLLGTALAISRTTS